MTRRLRIGIDAHAIGERLTGNERYIANVLPPLIGGSDHEFVLYFTHAEAMAAWSGLPRTTLRLMRPAHPAVRIPFVLPWHARRDRLDVLLVQYAGPPVPPCPLVTIVHDVAFLLFPGYYTRAERLWMPRAIPATMRRAAVVVTVSRFSESEIRRLCGLPADKIVVSHNAVAPALLGASGGAADPGARGEPDGPYFLAVGNLQPRKNLPTLVRAYRRLVEEHPDLPERLVIVGQDRYASQDIRDASEDLQRSGRLAFTGYVDDERLWRLLRGATAFVYPSAYEGFGLPPLEAIAAGTPALVGDIPVMRELFQDAAVLVPPHDDAAWGDALLEVASDPERRASLIVRGLDRASRFTPEASAEPLLAALERAAPSEG